MKTMRVPILIAIGVTLIGIIFGSFFDLEISKAIASPTNGFGLSVSIIAPTIGFCALAFVGGAFIAMALKQEWKIWIKIIFFAFAALAFGISTYYAGVEYFGINGFYKAAPDIVGFLIAAVCSAGAEVGGYFVFKDCQNRKAWLALLFVYVVLLIVLLVGVNTIKSIMHRPRYRLISVTDEVPFLNWWQRNSNYDYYITTLNYPKEDFKSFPSGHTAEASILLVVVTFAPLAHEKLRKIQLPVFIASCLFVMLVGFSRILAAAHFLSDVSMGAFITLLFTYIANEVAIHLKPLHPEE